MILGVFVVLVFIISRCSGEIAPFDSGVLDPLLPIGLLDVAARGDLLLLCGDAAADDEPAAEANEPPSE